jgi:hypothetical protein
MKRFPLIFVLSFLSVVVHGQSLLLKQPDLNNYDKIYIQDYAGKNPGPTIAEVRSFVWKHWTARTLGYAEMTLHNKEGEPTKYFIHIEPNESGIWHVSVRVESELYERRLIGDPKRTGEIKRRTNSYEAYIVEQVIPPKGKAVRTPQTMQGNLMLRFKDQNGQILAEL